MKMEMCCSFMEVEDSKLKRMRFKVIDGGGWTADLQHYVNMGKNTGKNKMKNEGENGGVEVCKKN